MNGQDVKDLNVVLERLAQHESRTKEMRDDIKFIKQNLFNPHEGLWAESRMNTQFRQNTTKWRFPIGVGFISLAIKHVWDIFNPA